MIFTNLVAGMVVLTWNGAIPTNTVSFSNYAFGEMFAQASNLLTCWKADIEMPVTPSAVTHFRPEAYPYAFGGTLVFSNRFAFTWMQGVGLSFGDKPNNCQVFLTDNVQSNDMILEGLMRATNLLTMKKAALIAANAIRLAGLPSGKDGFKAPVRKGQRKYEWKDGRVYPLPYYEFWWDRDVESCQVDVSGITSNIVDFSYAGPHLRFRMPTNYYDMLGLPPKPFFVKRVIFGPGQPPAYTSYPP